MLELKEGCELRCPACRHRDLTQTASLAHKAAFVQRRLGDAEPVVASPARWGYRRKVCLHAWYANGWRFGVRNRDDLVAIPHCPVHHPLVNDALQALGPQLPPDFPLAYYVQHGAQVTLVVRKPCELAVAPLPGVEGLWLHLNPCAGRRIFGKLPWRLLYGEPSSRDELGLWHGPSAFAQVIPELARAALDQAEEWLSGAHRVLDLCCGTGASLRRWGPRALGVELGKEAVEYARLNAPQAEVLRGTCAQRIPQLEAWASQGPYSLYANPPRLGLEEPVRHFLRRHPPQRAAYLSCSAGTLRRDLDDLGWQVERLVPFDFFPGTNHVEVLALCGTTDGGKLTAVRPPK